MPIENENNNGEFFYFNKETGKWTPLASVESFSCEIAFSAELSEEAEANLASIVEPLGDLEIVPNPGKDDKSGDGGKPGKSGNGSKPGNPGKDGGNDVNS